MKRLLLVCALFAPLYQPLAAMDPGAGPNVDLADNVEDIGEASPSSATPQTYGPMSELETLNDCAEVTLMLEGNWQKEDGD